VATLHEFVIMLDDLLEVYPRYWPISGESNDIEELRDLRQHSGNPKLLPRSEARMQLLEHKSLISSQTGRLDRGAIYRRG
jgi:hypothetical protein